MTAGSPRTAPALMSAGAQSQPPLLQGSVGRIWKLAFLARQFVQVSPLGRRPPDFRDIRDAKREPPLVCALVVTACLSSELMLRSQRSCRDIAGNLV